MFNLAFPPTRWYFKIIIVIIINCTVLECSGNISISLSSCFPVSGYSLKIDQSTCEISGTILAYTINSFDYKAVCFFCKPVGEFLPTHPLGDSPRRAAPPGVSRGDLGGRPECPLCHLQNLPKPRLCADLEKWLGGNPNLIASVQVQEGSLLCVSCLSVSFTGCAGPRFLSSRL